MKNEKYIELAKKIKKLAELGSEGEKEAAQSTLDRLMKKYYIRTNRKVIIAININL